MPYGWIFAYIIGNICMSAAAMSLRWANRGQWASCSFWRKSKESKQFYLMALELSIDLTIMQFDTNIELGLA